MFDVQNPTYLSPSQKMTSHELARKLLEGPDLVVELNVKGYIGEGGEYDAFWGDAHGMEIKGGKITLYAESEEEEHEDDED